MAYRASALWAHRPDDLSRGRPVGADLDGGPEASGTGNMKFTLNGALTIGTLDGANVEIRNAMGADNFFPFGPTAPQVVETRTPGYRPWDYYESNPALREVIDQIASDFFSAGQPDLFGPLPLVDTLLQRGEYLLLADYQSYVDCQDVVSATWCDTARWTRMSILNTVRAGYYFSDRSIAEYCHGIWNVKPLAIELE